MNPAQKIALWADELRHLSAMGLHFSRNGYDLANYRKIQQLSRAMMAMATGDDLDSMAALDSPVMRRPTPIVVCDAAIIDDDGRILLIRRADNGKWAMPGGAYEVGETPAEGAVREALEETGVHCQVVTLAGVHDSRRVGSETPHHLYMIMFLCKPLSGQELDKEPVTPEEVLDRRWFAQSALPPDMDPGHVSRVADAFRVWRGEACTAYDT